MFFIACIGLAALGVTPMVFNLKGLNFNHDEPIAGERWPQPAIAHESQLISAIRCDRPSET